jgi:hypothetical protein
VAERFKAYQTIVRAAQDATTDAYFFVGDGGWHDPAKAREALRVAREKLAQAEAELERALAPEVADVQP